MQNAGVALLSPSDVQAQAKAAFAAGDYERAAQLFQQAATGHGDGLTTATCHSCAAACFLKLGLPAVSVAACNQALAVIAAEQSSDAARSTAARALYRRSSALEQLGESTQAHADLLEAARTVPESQTALVPALAEAMRRAGEAWEPEELHEAGGTLLADKAQTGSSAPPPPPARSATEVLGELDDFDDADETAAAPASEAAARRRYLGELKGGCVPRCSMADPSEAARANELLRRGLPVVLTGGGVIGAGTAAGSWTAASLLERLRGTAQVAVIAPPAACRRFTYYQSRHHVGDYEFNSFFRPSDGAHGPATSAVQRSVEVDEADVEALADDAAQQKYWQLRVFDRDNGGFGACALPAAPASELRASINLGALEEIRRTAGLGELVVSQLFIAPADALSPCHYDEQHNVYCQLSGRKRFLIFAPDHAAPHLAPYPRHHCATRRARTDIEGSAAAEAVQGARRCEAGGSLDALRGTGVEATLEAGDALYLPAYWWHHVHALGHGSLSISFWLTPAKGLAQAVRQSQREQAAGGGGDAGRGADASVWRELRLRLAREAEEVVGTSLGPMIVRAFFLRLCWRCEQPCGTMLDSADAGWPVEYPLYEAAHGGDRAAAEADREDTLLLEPLLANWLLHRLGAILGSGGVVGFLHEFLGAGRFEGLL